MDITPKFQRKNGIYSLQAEILSQLNCGNKFDFIYVPTENDILHIENPKDADDFLFLVFTNGQWTTFKNSTFTERYQLIKEGKFELRQA